MFDGNFGPIPFFCTHFRGKTLVFDNKVGSHTPTFSVISITADEGYNSDKTKPFMLDIFFFFQIFCPINQGKFLRSEAL